MTGGCAGTVSPPWMGLRRTDVREPRSWRSARQGARHAGERERVGITDEEVGMRGEHAIGQEVAELRLGPAVHNAVNDAMKIGAWVDVVRDARRHDRQDVARPHAAFIEPCEQPIFATEHQAPELALASVVGGLDVPVFEEEQESRPLPLQVAEGFAERGLWRNDSLLLIDPQPELVENGPAELIASVAPLLGVIARTGRIAFDHEEAGDDAHAFERDAVAGARGFDKAASSVGPASARTSLGKGNEDVVRNLS